MFLRNLIFSFFLLVASLGLCPRNAGATGLPPGGTWGTSAFYLHVYPSDEADQYLYGDLAPNSTITKPLKIEVCLSIGANGRIQEDVDSVTLRIKSNDGDLPDSLNHADFVLPLDSTWSKNLQVGMDNTKTPPRIIYGPATTGNPKETNLSSTPILYRKTITWNPLEALASQLPTGSTATPTTLASCNGAHSIAIVQVDGHVVDGHLEADQLSWPNINQFPFEQNPPFTGWGPAWVTLPSFQVGADLGNGQDHLQFLMMKSDTDLENSLTGVANGDKVSEKTRVVCQVTLGAHRRISPAQRSIAVNLKDDWSQSSTKGIAHLKFDLATDAGGTGAWTPTRWRKATLTANTLGAWSDGSPLDGNDSGDVVIYRKYLLWDTTKGILNSAAPPAKPLADTLYSANGSHTLSGLTVEGANPGALGFESLDGADFATQSATNVNVDVENLVIVDASADDAQVSGGNPDYIKFDGESSDSLLKNPKIRFTIKDQGEAHQYQWTLHVMDTKFESWNKTAIIRGRASSPGEIVVTLNDPSKMGVPLQDVPLDSYTQNVALQDWGTYSFDMFVSEVADAQDTDVSHRLDFWSLKAPYNLTMPWANHHGDLEYDSQFRKQFVCGYALAGERDANAVQIDVLDPNFALKAHRTNADSGIGLATGQQYDGIVLYTLAESENHSTDRGCWIMLLRAEDKYADHYRDHRNKRTLAINRRAGWNYSLNSHTWTYIKDPNYVAPPPSADDEYKKWLHFVQMDGKPGPVYEKGTKRYIVDYKFTLAIQCWKNGDMMNGTATIITEPKAGPLGGPPIIQQSVHLSIPLSPRAPSGVSSETAASSGSPTHVETPSPTRQTDESDSNDTVPPVAQDAPFVDGADGDHSLAPSGDALNGGPNAASVMGSPGTGALNGFSLTAPPPGAVAHSLASDSPLVRFRDQLRHVPPNYDPVTQRNIYIREPSNAMTVYLRAFMDALTEDMESGAARDRVGYCVIGAGEAIVEETKTAAGNVVSIKHWISKPGEVVNGVRAHLDGLSQLNKEMRDVIADPATAANRIAETTESMTKALGKAADDYTLLAAKDGNTFARDVVGKTAGKAMAGAVEQEAGGALAKIAQQTAGSYATAKFGAALATVSVRTERVRQLALTVKASRPARGLAIQFEKNLPVLDSLGKRVTRLARTPDNPIIIDMYESEWPNKVAGYKEIIAQAKAEGKPQPFWCNKLARPDDWEKFKSESFDSLRVQWERKRKRYIRDHGSALGCPWEEIPQGFQIDHKQDWQLGGEHTIEGGPSGTGNGWAIPGSENTRHGSFLAKAIRDAGAYHGDSLKIRIHQLDGTLLEP